ETAAATEETAAETAEQPAEAAKETAAETADQPAEETAETAEQPAEETAAETENAEEEKKEPVTQEQVDAAKQAILDSVQAQVDEIMAKYAAGTPFADLIAEYGTDPGMTQEPNKTNGYAVHADSILWDPAFTAGAMGLKNVGDVSEPVLGSNGIHILHYTRDIPAGAVEFTEEMRAKLSEELLSDKENTAVMAMMDGWKAAAEIVYTEEGQAILDAAHQEDDASVETTEATEEVLSEGE
ncbi:MAG: peptidylprolyl isomerase, partial [Clostridiales bacterium]|nr:peptidylprolyl isomerase [Clostridiales bacterium]